MSKHRLSNVLVVVMLACSLLVIPAFADSQARVVRLSDVQGDVLIDRNSGQGYEKAFLNLPITQGVKIRTGSDGRAALEFEDASTLRITPNTVIDVPQLSLRDSGTKISTVHLQEGTAYVEFFGVKDDEFNLRFGRENLALNHPAHLRIEMGDTSATVAVFKGEVQVTGPSGTVEVSKKHTASFDLADNDHSVLAKEIAQAPYDSWDKQQSQYQQRYTDSSHSAYSPYAYGTSDLSYYGSFFSLPGYGMMWQPYFVGSGWDPFMNGAWAFYPSFGYCWVSSYPWGWTPYHYGSWVFVSPYGWMWRPGGTWMGWNTVPVVVSAPGTFVKPRAPAVPGPRIVSVNRGPAPVLLGKSSNKIEIPSNSAGLGIPRGTVRNLGHLSQTVQQRGFATTGLHPNSVAGSGWGRGGYSQPNSRIGAPVRHSSSPSVSAPAHSSTSSSSAHSTSGVHH